MSEMIKRRSIVELLSEGGMLAAQLSMGADDDAGLDSILSKFEAWITESEDKATAAKVVIKAMEGEADRFKAAEKQIAERRKSIEASVDKLRDRTLLLAEALLEGTGKKSVDLLDGGKLTVTERTNLAVVVTNEWELPSGLTKTVTTPDLTAIKAYFKVHGAVPGADVTETTTHSLTIK